MNDVALTHGSVHHPRHYTSHPSGVECITITEHFNFNLGNAIKYIWRSENKEGGKKIIDLEKAVWYAQREIERLKTKEEKATEGMPFDANAYMSLETAQKIVKVIEETRRMGGRIGKQEIEAYDKANKLLLASQVSPAPAIVSG